MNTVRSAVWSVMGTLSRHGVTPSLQAAEEVLSERAREGSPLMENTPKNWRAFVRAWNDDLRLMGKSELIERKGGKRG